MAAKTLPPEWSMWVSGHAGSGKLSRQPRYPGLTYHVAFPAVCTSRDPEPYPPGFFFMSEVPRGVFFMSEKAQYPPQSTPAELVHYRRTTTWRHGHSRPSGACGPLSSKEGSP